MSGYRLLGMSAAQVLAVDIASAFERMLHVSLLHKAQVAGNKGLLLRRLADYLTAVLNGC